MTDQFAIRLARMHYEIRGKAGLPARLCRLAGKSRRRLVLEYGYGSGIGFTEQDYLSSCDQVTFASHTEVFKQDNVLVLRSPDEEDLRLLKPGACLMSMLHYGTRPKRVALLRSREISISSFSPPTTPIGT